MAETGAGSKKGVITADDVLICDAICCCYDGFECNPETCIGCAEEGACLCCKTSCCLKMPCKPYSQCTLCHWCCFCAECSMGEGFTLCKSEDQCFCYVRGCACPTDEDVPCMCTLIPFCLVYPKCACCKKFKEVAPSKKEMAPAGAPPQTELMDR